MADVVDHVDVVEEVAVEELGAEEPAPVRIGKRVFVSNLAWRTSWQVRSRWERERERESGGGEGEQMRSTRPAFPPPRTRPCKSAIAGAPTRHCGRQRPRDTARRGCWSPGALDWRDREYARGERHTRSSPPPPASLSSQPHRTSRTSSASAATSCTPMSSAARTVSGRFRADRRREKPPDGEAALSSLRATRQPSSRPPPARAHSESSCATRRFCSSRSRAPAVRQQSLRRPITILGPLAPPLLQKSLTPSPLPSLFLPSANQTTGRSKGWGIVEFETPEEVRPLSCSSPGQFTFRGG